jgi:hypothetical protein
LKNAIKPQWLKNAIKQFENDLQGDGLHSFYKYYMLTFIFPGEKEDRIDLFRDYLANMELLTESTVKKLSEYVAPTINEGPTTAYDQYELETWLAYEYDIWVRQKELAGNFVYVLRNSFFVNLCSFLETHLVDLSSSEARSSIVITAVKSLVGELIKKVPEWEMIMHYIDIRNCIVHSDGFLNESSRDKKIRDFSSRTKNLLIRENKVILEKGFCEDATETVSRFLRKLDVILIDIK